MTTNPAEDVKNYTEKMRQDEARQQTRKVVNIIKKIFVLKHSLIYAKFYSTKTDLRDQDL